MISHKHKAIFVHIPKTAGQSIEQVFVDDLGLTWEERGPLLLRYNSDAALGPERLAHLYADEYVELGHIDQDQFSRYFKFAVVRNPYDRILSEYRYRKFHRTGPLWWFLRKHYDNDRTDMARHVAPQVRYLLDTDGHCLVDKIVHFESLNDQIAPVFAHIFGEVRHLPLRNKSKHERRRLSRHDLSAKNRALIHEMYRADFEFLGYDPDS